ncbi:MAG: hypothetical protein R2706_13675 [Acidimicrobiales bacterium]
MEALSAVWHRASLPLDYRSRPTALSTAHSARPRCDRFRRGLDGLLWVFALTGIVGGDAWDYLERHHRQSSPAPHSRPAAGPGQQCLPVLRSYGATGALAGGISVKVSDHWFDRELALRYTWYLSGALTLLLALYGRRHFTTAKLLAAQPPQAEATRSESIA